MLSQVPCCGSLCIFPEPPNIIHQLLLSFFTLSFGHMGEPHHQHLHHHQIVNNIYCPLIYHHILVAWCYQYWILSSTLNFCTLPLNVMIWDHGIQSPLLRIWLSTLLNLIEYWSRNIGQIHWIVLSTDITSLTSALHHKNSTTETRRIVHYHFMSGLSL